MSYLPFADQNVAAATLSNLVVYKASASFVPGAVPVNTLLFTTAANMGQFVPLEVWFHVDDNSANNAVTVTCSVGHNGPATYDNICASAIRGSGATVALQLRQYKAVVFPTRIASTYYQTATPANVATGVYVRMTGAPGTLVTGTFFVVGYYTGMRQ